MDLLWTIVVSALVSIIASFCVFRFATKNIFHGMWEEDTKRQKELLQSLVDKCEETIKKYKHEEN